MNDDSPFKIEKDGFLTWLTLNRPAKRNSMTSAFFEGLLDLFPKFDEDPEVRVVIIKAEGKSFTAGIDLFEFFDPSRDQSAGLLGNAEAGRKRILRLQDTMTVIEKCRKPVIAAVHSHCIGGGVDMVSACDIRIAARDAIFSIRETRVAIVADLGTLQRLPKIIGEGRARELALTGRDFTAEEALEMGFITRICEDRETLYAEAKRLGEEIASNSPITVQGVKDVLNYSRDNGVFPGLEYVAQKNIALLPNDDLKEAVTAFIQKRKPNFRVS
ncbi:MAG: crotonase/enoyl-CoA hydratase family protein [Deltaproteobacteria bacterium]|nr:crotonase/enoyl-CoA hydratase family protein [Deltaproteobacteria bacterium]